MRYTLDTVVLICCTSSSSNVVMFNQLPFLRFNVVLNSSSIIINWKTNQTYFITPVFTSCLKHMLVVSHRGLAWWTPSCPKIKKYNLSLFVLDSSGTWLCDTIDINLVCILDLTNLRANTKARPDVNLSTLNWNKCFWNFFSNGWSQSLSTGWSLTFNSDKGLNLLFFSSNIVNNLRSNIWVCKPGWISMWLVNIWNSFKDFLLFLLRVFTPFFWHIFSFWLLLIKKIKEF